MIPSLLKKITSQTTLSIQEAYWLLEHIVELNKQQLLSVKSLTMQQTKDLEQAIVDISVHHKPLAYIIGFVPFLDLHIHIYPPILIPRPETEEWTEKIIKIMQPYHTKIKNILDIGTGSGCIALALAKNFPTAHVTAVDINPQALQLAQQNAIENKILNIEFLHSNLFENVSTATKFDVIVSNPPYINPTTFSNISPEVTAWEDNNALFAENQGTALIENILKNSSNYVDTMHNLPYQLVMEIDSTQFQSVPTIASKYGWNCSVEKDSFGNYRTIWCKAQ